MAFRWRADDGPLTVAFGSSHLSTTNKKKKTNWRFAGGPIGPLIVIFESSLLSTTKTETLSKVDPSVKQNFLDPRIICPDETCQMHKKTIQNTFLLFKPIAYIKRERERERVYRSIICLHLSVCPFVCQSVFYKDVTIYFYSSSLGTVETTRQMKRSCRPGRWNDLQDPAKTDCLGMWIWKGSVCLSRSDESVYVDQMKQSCRSGRWNKVVDPADDTLWQTRQMTRSGRPAIEILLQIRKTGSRP